jgi:demethylmenaquinone methyltransferase/2-methoxy-6-polyprenyl-1,4-benzoquinol methylase
MSYLFKYYAKKYDRFMRRFHLDDDTVILDIIGHGNKRIADIGGGTGRTADKLIKLGHFVTIIDPCISMTKRAKKRNQKIRIISQPMPFDMKEEYDVILFRDCLHHIKEQRKTLYLCYNKLRDDGMIIIADFSPRSIRTKLIFLFERLCFERIWELDEKKLLKLLKSFNMNTQLIKSNDRDYLVIGRKTNDRISI